MDITSLLSELAKTVLSTAVEMSGLDERLRAWLKKDPAKLAFEKDLAKAYAALARGYPEIVASLFDESFLLNDAAPLLAQMLMRSGAPDPAVLVNRWIEVTGIKTITRTGREMAVRAVSEFLERLDAEMRNEAVFQTLFDSRALDCIDEKMDALLEAIKSEREKAVKQAERYQPVVVKNSQNVVIGDHNATTISYLFYQGDFDTLADLYVPPDPVFERVRVDEFVGREWLEEKVCQFLEKHPSGVFTLVGEAGMGKTAFLAHLVNKYRYLHLFGEQLRGEAHVSRALKSLGSQIVTRFQLDEYQDKDTLPQAAQYPDYLDRLLRKAAEKLAAGEKIVIVCDALDEAGVGPNGNVFGLPEGLPKGVYLIVSKRPVSVKLYVDADQDGARLSPGGPENEKDIEVYLSTVSNRPAVFQQPKADNYSSGQFIQTLTKKSEGVWIYLHYVIKEIENGSRAPLNLSYLPQGLSEYYRNYWEDWSQGRRGEGRQTWDDFYLPLLGILAAAQEPVTAKQMADYTGWPAKDENKIDRLLSREWSPYITRQKGPSGRDQYRIYHASLSEFLNGKDIEKCGDPANRDFLEELKDAVGWGHEQITGYYRKQCAGKWIDLIHDDYARMHLVRHLASAQQTDVLDDLLLYQCEWAIARFHQEGHYSGYLSDLELLRELPEKELTLERQIRLALCASSVISLGSNLDAELLGQCVEAGVMQVEAALAHARQDPDPDRVTRKLVRLLDAAEAEQKPEIAGEILLRLERNQDSTKAESIVRIFLWLSPKERQQALDAARAIENKGARARALTGLAPHLTLEQRQQALDAARAIEDEYARARALTGLAPHLTPEQRQQALDAARAIEDEYARAEALAGLAPHLTSEQRQQALEEALETARAIEDEYTRARALAGLAPHLSPEQRQQVLDAARAIEDEGARADALTGLASHLTPKQRKQALDAARAIRDEDVRAVILTGMAPQLPAEQRQQAMQEALKAAQVIEDDNGRIEALTGLAPHLTPEQRQQALDAARAIENEYYRARALTGLAPYLTPEQRQQALDAVRAIRDGYYRARALTGLAPHLTPKQRQQALDAARAIEYGYARVDALIGLAPHLAPKQRQQALEEALKTARAIHNEYYRARALTGLAPHLTPEQRQQALDATRAIRDGYYRVEALTGLAPHLTPEQRQQALDVARAIENEYYRARALTGLAPYLTPEQRQQALDAARVIKYGIARADALTGLAPHLTLKQRQQALDAARAIEYGYARVDALIGLAPNLTPEQRQKVLDAVRAIRDEGTRAKALTGLAPHLSPEQRQQALEEALDATRAIRDDDARAEALTGLAPHLTSKQRLLALEEVLKVAQRPDDRARILTLYLTTTPVDQQATVLQKLMYTFFRIETYQIDSSISAIIENLEPAFFSPLLRLALDQATSAQSLGILLGILKTWKGKPNFHLFRDEHFLQPALKAFSHGGRRELLQVLAIAAETIFDLGGGELAQATAEAIFDTAEWWR